MVINRIFHRLPNWLYMFVAVMLVLNTIIPGNPAYASHNQRPFFRPYYQTPPGDVDGNGNVDIEDARLVARYVVGQIITLPHPENADATQDGTIAIDDALAIAQRTTGRSRIVMAIPEYGLPGEAPVGSTLRIWVFEHFYPFNIISGTVRIKSTSTSYDSGDQLLTFERDGRSLYYHWDTTGLVPANDYEIYVTLTETETKQGGVSQASPNNSDQAETLVSLKPRSYELPYLAQAVDAYAAAPGFPLEFRRVVPNDSATAPYLGPLGRGWMHNFDVRLEEFTNGRIAFHGPDGFNRWFQSNADGTYSASPGDYAALTRDPDSTFQLREKNGFIYRFRSDLRLDYLQDTNGNRISAVYDESKNLVEVRHSCGVSFSLEYNEAGRLIRLSDHAGRVTVYEYDPTNLMLISVTDPSGEETRYAYSVGESEALNYRLLSIAFPDGTYAHYAYDAQARLTRQTGTWGANPVSYRYDSSGTLHVTDAVSGTTTIQVNDRGQPVSITEPDGGQTQMQYNISANLTGVTDPLSHPTRFGYDQFGNIVTITNPLSETARYGYDPQFSKPISITNPLGHTTLFDYDSNGNLLRTTYPDLNQETYAYDLAGNPISFTDVLSNTTSYLYNSQGLMTSLENALGSVTQFAYNTTGDLEQVTDANGHVVSYTRDTLGRVTRVTYPGGSHEDYEYDAIGKVTAFTNRRGERISFSYDLTGRLEWKVYPSGYNFHFQYDDRGIISSIEAVTGTQPTTTTVGYYEYDLSRRLTLAKVPGDVAPESYDVSYAYDAAGNRRLMAYPDGYGLNYEYDDANRLIRITDVSDNTIVAYQYDAASRRTRRTLGNGTYTIYEYDSLDRLIRLTNYALDDTVQSQFEYTYNAAGMRTSMTTLEGIHTYTYDSLYQLTGVAYPDGRTVDYAFDALGNRTVVTDTGVATSYTTNALDQYMQVGTDTFGYDINGNLITRTLGSDVITYGWDEDDRLVSVDRDGVHIQYLYDYQGRLVAKIVGGQETRYIWDDINLIAEMDSAGNVVKRYIYGASINEVLVVTAGGTKHWGQQDGLGSVVGTTDDSGVVATASSYDVYGNVRSGDLGPVPQRFAGMWWDEDAGLYYVRARWYESRLGRFYSVDPVKNTSGINLYVYSMNNPTNLTDRLGLESSEDWNPFETLVKPFQEVIRDYDESFEQWYYDYTHPKPPTPDWPRYTPAYEMGRELIDMLGNMPPGFGGPYSGIFDLFTILDAFLDWADQWSIVDYGNGGDGGGGRGGGGGGVCPTFIQLPSGALTFAPAITHLDVRQEPLAGEITVPIEGALLRSDIPIFGVAGGTNFTEYRVEYGEGNNPAEWQLIASSTISQPTTDVGLAEMRLMQGDVDIRGNLATWNTGLKNWVHLPWHPPEDPTDLNGIYTLRLVVTGKDGQQVEDRMTVEVGRAIAQALPGIAISPDQRVTLRFPEQSLTYPFRVYTILPFSGLGEESPPAPEGVELLGSVYRIREPGDRFIKDVSLEFTASEEELSGRNPGNVGIVQYDIENMEWNRVTTAFSITSEGTTFSTLLTKLPKSMAVFALAFDPSNASRSQAAKEKLALRILQPVSPGILAWDTFEQGTGGWTSRDRFVGAILAPEEAASVDGSHALKITNESQGGNFSVAVLEGLFDAREYPLMNFDYRIPPGVKTGFYLHVNGRWYNLGFTDDSMEFRDRDVNIANLGRIDGILADDQWHSASVNLYELLRQKTRHTLVDDIVMADWDIGGYMKLDFGNNARGATYYIDNFKLAADPEMRQLPESLQVDNFNSIAETNMLAGSSGVFSNPGTDYCQANLMDPATNQDLEEMTRGANGALKLNFDTSRNSAYCGYWTALMAADLEEMGELALRLRSEGEVPPLYLGLRHAATKAEAKVLVQPYLSPPDPDGWRSVTIPLSVFRTQQLPDLSLMDVLFITFENTISSGQGSLYIDDLHFRKDSTFSTVADFNLHPPDVNLLGGASRAIETEAATISVGSNEERGENGENDASLRISYGGTIGLDYGQGRFSYGIWETDLRGFDARPFRSLVIKLRGENGGEQPNIYLADGMTRRPVRGKEFLPLTTSWQEIRLPLDAFASQGIDLSRLERLQVAFEWQEMSGTIYIDEIRFDDSGASLIQSTFTPTVTPTYIPKAMETPLPNKNIADMGNNTVSTSSDQDISIGNKTLIFPVAGILFIVFLALGGFYIRHRRMSR